MFCAAFDVLIKILESYRPQIPLDGGGGFTREANRDRGEVRSGLRGFLSLRQVGNKIICFSLLFLLL